MSAHEQPNLTPDEREIENALREWQPVAPEIDRERLLFDAGWQAALAQHSVDHSPTRSLRRWQAAAASLAAACLALVVTRPEALPPATPSPTPTVAQQADEASPPVAKVAEPIQPSGAVPVTTPTWLLRLVALQPAESSYLALRDQALQGEGEWMRLPHRRLEAPGLTSEPERRPLNARQMLERLLPQNEPGEPGEPSEPATPGDAPPSAAAEGLPQRVVAYKAALVLRHSLNLG